MTVESPHIAPGFFSEYIQMFLESPMIPSPHSIELSHSATSDYLYRQVRSKPHLAELYHENSKLSPHSTLQVPLISQRLNRYVGGSLKLPIALMKKSWSTTALV